MTVGVGGASVSRTRRIVGVAALVSVVGIAAACAPTAHGGGGGGTAPGQTATLSVGGGSVTAVVAAPLTVTLVPSNAALVPGAPSGLVFPLGALDLRVQHASPGAVVHVTVTVQSAVATFRKLIGGVWDAYVPDGTTGGVLAMDGRTITLDIRDGGRGDMDGVADGTIIDDFAPANFTAVTITSGELPVLVAGQPYSHQLQASGPGPAPIVWSLLAGALPAGLSLDPSGLLSGTPAGGGPQNLFRLAATDDSTSDSKLFVTAENGTTVHSASVGVPVPDGSRIAVYDAPYYDVNHPDFSFWIGQVDATGVMSRVDRTSVERFSGRAFGDTFVNPAGTQAVLSAGASGPVDVVDADTGATIATVEPSPSFGFAGATFSPSGAYLALRGATGETRIFDTTTWTETGTIPAVLAQVWSTSSEELAASSMTPGNVTIYPAADPANPREVHLDGQGNCFLGGWSSTGRFAFNCGNSIVTASSTDGSDVRLVARGLNSDPPGNSNSLNASFSPSGQKLAIAQSLLDGTSRVVIVDDVADAPATVIATSAAGYFLLPMAWS